MSIQDKKIYLTSLHLKHGGVERVIISLANAFAKKGAQVVIFCTYRLGAPAYELDSRVTIRYLTDCRPNREAFQAAVRSRNPVAVFREGVYALRVLRKKKKTMKKAIQSVSEGVIISTRHEHSLLLSKYGKPEVKKIAQLHHDHGFDKKLLQEIQTCYGGIDDFLLLTPQNTQEIQELLRGHNSHTKCLTVPNFLDKLYAGPWPERKNQVIAVGRLETEKGFDRLLEIWKQVSSVLPGWTLKLVGGGSQETFLRKKAEELGISETVCFTGILPYDAVLSEMASSKIYAMTSYTESFGLVLAEAQSCKLPVVAFDVRVGPRALVTDGVNGYLVPDGDLDAFGQKTLRLAQDMPLREAFGEAARRNSEQYEESRVMKLWEQLL